MLTLENRQAIVDQYKTNPKDTGSAQVQVALLTARINYLNDHLKVARKDHASRRGLLRLVGQRNRLLKYLNRENHEQYKTLIGNLGLRK